MNPVVWKYAKYFFISVTIMSDVPDKYFITACIVSLK